jgi:hypothetical protein
MFSVTYTECYLCRVSQIKIALLLNVIMLNVIMLNVIMLNVIMLNVIMLNVIMLNVILLSVIMLSDVMLNVVAPVFRLVSLIFATEARAYSSGASYNTPSYECRYPVSILLNFVRTRFTHSFVKLGCFQRKGIKICNGFTYSIGSRPYPQILAPRHSA